MRSATLIPGTVLSWVSQNGQHVTSVVAPVEVASAILFAARSRDSFGNADCSPAPAPQHLDSIPWFGISARGAIALSISLGSSKTPPSLPRWHGSWYVILSVDLLTLSSPLLTRSAISLVMWTTSIFEPWSWRDFFRVV